MSGRGGGFGESNKQGDDQKYQCKTCQFEACIRSSVFRVLRNRCVREKWQQLDRELRRQLQSASDPDSVYLLHKRMDLLVEAQSRLEG